MPLVNIEAYLGVRAAVAGVDDIWLLALVAAAGQMVGKMVWYYLGASALHWGWVRRKIEQPKNAARLETWRGPHARAGRWSPAAGASCRP